MKTVGILGGTGPQATIDYYRLIVATYLERKADGNYPSIIINSINMRPFLNLIQAIEHARAAALLTREVARLANAGAHFAILSSCTAHVVFDEVRSRSAIPLISIVEATRAVAEGLAVRKVGLIGTRFTMQGRFFPDTFAASGINLSVPDPDEQDYVHDRYMNELVEGVFLPETRLRLLTIIDRMRSRHGIQAIVLGGTELPLLLRGGPNPGIPFLDTTKIHVDTIVAELLAT